MSFETPAAFWGLSALLLLVLFSLWRQAAVRTVVPSLLLWKKIPERNPPIRALRRPQVRVELLLQALAVAAMVAALAGPFVRTSQPKPRRIAFVIDTSARLQAGGRLDLAKREARRLIDGPLAHDQVTFFAAVPDPRRLGSLDEAIAIDAHVDLDPLLAAARLEAEHVVVFGDRPVGGTPAALFGGPAGNAGIVDFAATDSEVFVRLVNHGAPRKAVVRVEWADQKVEEPLDLPAERGWSLRRDFSKAAEVRVTLDGDDGFALDNSVRATRLGAPGVAVAIAGLEMPLLHQALAAIPGVSRRDGPGALLGIGVDAAPPRAPFAVWVHFSAAALPPGGWAVAVHPLTEGLETRQKEWDRACELPPEARAGEPLIQIGGKRVAVLREGVLHLAVDPSPRGWPSTPSFPIFWKNVVDFASKGGSAFTIVRTGRPQTLPSEASEVGSAPPGARYGLSPSGRFVAWTRGAYGFRTAGGVRSVEANLLDERESDTAGVTRPLDWKPESPEGREVVKRGLAGGAAGLALLLLAAAWALQRRTD